MFDGFVPSGVLINGNKSLCPSIHTTAKAINAIVELTEIIFYGRVFNGLPTGIHFQVTLGNIG